MAIKLLITDFDGTLVDTFEANYRSYSLAFESVGLSISRSKYRECFGLRFDHFMDAMCIDNPSFRSIIREKKADFYPKNFSSLKLNRPLMDFITAFHRAGGKTAIASTARECNLLKALRYLDITEDFDLILAGEHVAKGKPDPEIYLSVLNLMGIAPLEALVFEDSEAGIQAAKAAGLSHIAINPVFFGNGN